MTLFPHRLAPAALALAALLAPPALAGEQSNGLSVAEAACTVFAGTRQCDTVSIDDTENCVLKVLAGPAPKVEPEYASCLFDEVGTAKVHLSRMTPAPVQVTGLGIRVAGTKAVELVTRYGDGGAPVWEPKDGHTFPLRGAVADTRRALHALRRLSAELCTGATAKTASAIPATLPATGPVMTPTEAHEKAAAGEVLLVDIRHEAEWRATGVAPTARPISMHQNIADFVNKLSTAAGGDKAKPVALICAEGVRSAHMQRALKLYGFTQVINVAEGMAGGRFGPGWMKAGLPVTPFRPQQSAR